MYLKRSNLHYKVHQIKTWFSAWQGIHIYTNTGFYIKPKQINLSWAVYNKKTNKIVGETFNSKYKAYKYKRKLEKQWKKRKLQIKSKNYSSKSHLYQAQKNKA